MTYREIGIQEGLKGFRLDFFVSYMVQRWGDTETQKCEDGYAVEWARHWLTGTEWTSSDEFGRLVIKNIYEGHWNSY